MAYYNPDKLTESEMSAAIQLVYARQYFPEQYKAFMRDLHENGGDAGELDGLIAGEYSALNGLTKALHLKKLKKIMKKTNPVYIASRVLPGTTRARLSDWEQKHRTDIKKVGLLAGAIFFPGIGMLGNIGAHLGASATALKAGALKFAAEHGITSALTAAKAQFIASVPGATSVSQVLGSQLGNAVKTIGEAKIAQLVAKYTHNGQSPIESPDDPRYGDMMTELQRMYQQSGAGGGGAPPFPTGGAADDVNDALTDETTGADSGGGINPLYLAGGLLAAFLVMR